MRRCLLPNADKRGDGGRAEQVARAGMTDSNPEARLTAGDFWRRISLMVAALWWGVLMSLAFVAVPTLFAKLGNPGVAGPVAAWLFSFLCKLTWVCGACMLVYSYKKRGLPPIDSGFSAMYFTAVAMLAAAVQDGWVAHMIVTARASGADLKLWHMIGSGLVLAQWLASTLVLWRLTRLPPQAP